MLLNRERSDIRCPLDQFTFFRVWTSLKAAIHLEGSEQSFAGRNNRLTAKLRESTKRSFLLDGVQEVFRVVAKHYQRDDVAHLKIDRGANSIKYLRKGRAAEYLFKQAVFPG